MLFDKITVEQLLALDPSGRQLFKHCFDLIMSPSTPFPFSPELNRDLHLLFNAIADRPDATRGVLPTPSGLNINVMAQTFSWATGVGDQIAKQAERELCSQKSTELAKMGYLYGRGLINPNDNGNLYKLSWLDASGIRSGGDLNTFNHLISNRRQVTSQAVPQLVVFQARTLLEAKAKMGSEVDKNDLPKTIAALNSF